MKRLQINALMGFLFFVVLTTGCNKEGTQPDLKSESSNTLKTSFDAKTKGSDCKLLTWKGLDDGYLRTLHYNSKDLMDTWHEVAPLSNEDLLFTITYEPNKRVANVKYFDHGVLSYTIIPIYKSKRIAYELWYDGNTKTIVDSIVNTYNSSGQLVKRSSVPGEYYCTFQYDGAGNIPTTVLKDNNGFIYELDIEYFKKPVLEPMSAAPGMPYPIPFINYIIDKQKYSYIASYTQDNNGNLTKIYEQDNSRSVLTALSNSYASFYDTYDFVSGLRNRQVWTYDECGKSKDDDKISDKTNSSTLGLQSRPLRMMPSPELMKRIKAMRNNKGVY